MTTAIIFSWAYIITMKRSFVNINGPLIISINEEGKG